MKDFSKNGLANIVVFQGKTIYNAYNAFKKGIPKKDRITDRSVFRAVVSEIFKKVANDLVENEGGVLVKEWGYFFIFRGVNKYSFIKRKDDGTDELIYNARKNMRIIMPIFMPHTRGTNSFHGWSMDRAFTQNIRNRLTEKLYSGVKYKCYPYTLLKLRNF